MAQTDFLASKRNEIRKRLTEIKPLYEEYLQLEKAEAALASVGGTVKRAVTRRGPGRPRTKTKRRGPGRPPRATAKRGPGRPPKRGPGRPRTKGRVAGKAAPTARRRRGKTRADQAIDLVKKNPGITVSQMAKKMGIRQNYLYRVIGNLQEQGLVSRRNKGFHPK